MARAPTLVPVSDLRRAPAGLLAQVRKTKQPVVITLRGRAAAVMISMESYEKNERERDLLLRIARGERDISKGKGFDCADVMASADRIIKK